LLIEIKQSSSGARPIISAQRILDGLRKAAREFAIGMTGNLINISDRKPNSVICLDWKVSDKLFKIKEETLC
jgi:hypothetical protein